MTTHSWHNLDSNPKNISVELLNWCAALDLQLFGWPWQHADWLSLTKTNRKYLLVWSENKAFALWELDNHPHAYLLKIMTKVEFRGTGIASLLMDESVKTLRHLHFKDATLEVQVDNKAAISFYLSHSWQQVRRVKAFYANGQDALTMLVKL